MEGLDPAFAHVAVTSLFFTAILLFFHIKANRKYSRLLASEARFRTIFHTSPDSIAISRLEDGLMIDINEGFSTLTGYAPDEVIGSTALDLGLWVKPEERLEIVRKLQTEDRVHNTLTQLRRKDGSSVDVLISTRKTLFNGSAHRVSIARDITDLLRYEKAIRFGEERYRYLLNAGSDAILVYSLGPDDMPGTFTEVNDVACAMFGYDRNELLNMSTLDLVPEEFHSSFGGVMEDMMTQKHLIFEQVVQKKDGKRLQVEISNHMFRLAGQPTFMSIARDITDRKIAELRLHNTLREKEVLLKEIHHRVKNNLQVVSGLLNVQCLQISDEKMREACKENQNRIVAMALVHQMLYEDGDLSSIDFGTFLENLVASLFKSYSVDPDQIKLEISVDCGTVPIDTAIPCGLIVNEMITNSFKHAFPDDRPGTVSINFHCPGEDLYSLAIADNGVGLKGGKNLEEYSSMGMQLISSLGSQLGATMEINGEGGTSYNLTFREYREAETVVL